jgi:hypothetical protein
MMGHAAKGPRASTAIDPEFVLCFARAITQIGFDKARETRFLEPASFGGIDR